MAVKAKCDSVCMSLPGLVRFAASLIAVAVDVNTHSWILVSLQQASLQSYIKTTTYQIPVILKSYCKKRKTNFLYASYSTFVLSVVSSNKGGLILCVIGAQRTAGPPTQ